jgi:hypothetical protein
VYLHENKIRVYGVKLFASQQRQVARLCERSIVDFRLAVKKSASQEQLCSMESVS